MDIKLKERASSVAYLVDRLNMLGYYSKQFGPEVVVKHKKGGAYGFHIIFGAQKTYLNDFTSGLKSIPTHAGEIVEFLGRYEPSAIREVVKCIPSILIEESNANEAIADVDELRKLFPPELSVNDLMNHVRQHCLPCSVVDNRVAIYACSMPLLPIGHLCIRENLWFLSLPNRSDLRIRDTDLFDLIYELESIWKQGGDEEYEALKQAYSW